MEVIPMKWNPFVLLAIALLSWSTICAEPREPAHFPSLVSSLKVARPLEFCGERVPIEIQEVRERLEKELLLSLWDRPQVILWLKRSRRHLPHIEEILEKNGVPDDLKYLAIAEGALRPHAASRKGAVGFWQFTEYTGRENGLVINERIDERRNIFTSTQAATQYFTRLHGTFGSWALAAAAYNMGEEGLMTEILEQGTNDYYYLYLPLETQRYIFRILSVKLIFSNPERYGFQLSPEDYYPPFAFDRIRVDCFRDTPIRIIAQAAKTHFKVIKDLNPEIRGRYLPEGSREILIPKGAARDFHARYRDLLRQWSRDQEERIYVVKKGDSLSSIANRFDVPLLAIIFWNRLDPKKPIHPGDELIIYRRGRKRGDIEEDGDDPHGND